MRTTSTTTGRKLYTDTGRGWITRCDGRVEAVRYYRHQGATFSGWIVRSTSDRYCYSDPIETKAEAISALLTWNT